MKMRLQNITQRRRRKKLGKNKRSAQNEKHKNHIQKANIMIKFE